MYCANCKVEMNEAKTKMEVPGKEGTVVVTNVPCSVCPVCNATIIDSLSTSLAQKAGKKVKASTLDFEKMHGISIVAGKL